MAPSITEDVDRNGRDHQTPECWRSVRPICLFATCCGFVLLISGVVSVFKYGSDTGRFLLLGVGFTVVSLGIIVYVIFKLKAQRVDLNPFKSVLKLQNTERTTESVTVELNPCNAQPVTEGNNRVFGSEWSTSVSTVPRISARQSASVVEHKEYFMLPVVGQFEIPPSYEEATSANDRPTSIWKLEKYFSVTIVRESIRKSSIASSSRIAALCTLFLEDNLSFNR